MAQRVKRLPAMQETWIWSLDQEDPLEKKMAPHSSTLAWKIPWTEKPGRLQSMGLQRVDWATSLSFLSLSGHREMGVCAVPKYNWTKPLLGLTLYLWGFSRDHSEKREQYTWNKDIFPGTSLAAQWLRLRASTAGVWIWSLVRELRAHMFQGAVKKKKKRYFPKYGPKGTVELFPLPGFSLLLDTKLAPGTLPDPSVFPPLALPHGLP